MRVFVTGASGWIGSAVVPALLEAGHQVVGLARSEASAEALARAGAEIHRGNLDDLARLRAGAAASDGVIHLAYNHDFSDIPAAARTDLRAVEAIGAELEGSGRPLVIASGTLGVAPGRIATERDRPAPGGHPRQATAEAVLAMAERGVRSSVVRLSPSVHGDGDDGFVPTINRIARDKGVSGYIGDGSNSWTAVHRSDAAQLFRLALERAEAGSVLHGVADESVRTRAIAEVIGRRLAIPAVTVAPEAAAGHFGWIGAFFALDAPASSVLTREKLGWQPVHPGLIDDLEQGSYFARATEQGSPARR